MRDAIREIARRAAEWGRQGMISTCHRPLEEALR